ncbi:MAG: ComEC/Rec2 family competence protein [Clostridia bacterium]|nr:ComEC/Rec2 family competence protein [Clostridia bacterium]
MKRIKRPFAVSAVSILFADIIMMLGGSDTLFILILIFSFLCTVFAIRRAYLSKIFLLACSFFIISGILFTGFSGISEAVTQIQGDNLKVSGTVFTYPLNTAGDSVNFILTDAYINDLKVHGKISVYSDDTQSFIPGDKISFVADSVTDNTSDGIYKYHSLSDKTYLLAFAYNGITLTETHSENNIYTKILSLRKWTTDKFFSNLPEETAAVTTALITGDKTYLSDEVLAYFKISGVSHIFAVSGMHLSLWTGIFFLIFKQRARSSITPNLAALLFILFYLIFTGFSPSVIRSGIMLGTVFIAKIIKRHSDPLNTWGIAGTLMLLSNPFLAGNVSFLLSYLAVFAIIFSSQYILPLPFNEKTKFIFVKNKLLAVINTFLLSLLVILMTLPITTVFFGYISLLSPLMSLILTPVAELVMTTAGISLFIPEGNIFSNSLFKIIEFFSEIILDCTAFMKNFDFAVYATDIKLILPWSIITAAVVAISVLIHKNRKTTLKYILLSLILLVSSTIISESSHRGETSVFIPSCENATCITVSQANKSMIYGSGGSYKACSEVISHLNSKGILLTDYLFIPRIQKSESKNTEYLKTKLLPDNTVMLYGENKTVYQDKLWNGADIYCETSDSFSASVLYIDNIKIVICSLPGSDFSTADKRFSEGDILICRSKIPKTLDSSKFNTVIVMTDKKLSSTSQNTFSTKNSSIEITLKGDTYAVNR